MIFTMPVKTFTGIKSVIRLPCGNQFFGILPVNALALTLSIRPISTILSRAFIVRNATPVKRFYYISLCSLNISVLIGVFYPQNKTSNL